LQWQSARAGAWGLLAVEAPRDRSCARRERWGRLGFRAVARGGSGCRRSYARSGPIPLPLRGLGYVPLWGGLSVANEEKQSSLTRCVVVRAVMAQGRWGLWGLCGVRSAPTGHRIPARGETPGMTHNRCVLKERRIHPGALTCFAVAERRGWRLGLVGGGGSAGSILRSQGTLGPVGLSRGRATGFVVRFQCSLRPDPATASAR
jgi:hypothetical protein